MRSLNHSRKINGTGHEGGKTPREYFPVVGSRDAGLLDLGWQGKEQRSEDLILGEM